MPGKKRPSNEQRQAYQANIARAIDARWGPKTQLADFFGSLPYDLTLETINNELDWTKEELSEANIWKNWFQRWHPGTSRP